MEETKSASKTVRPAAPTQRGRDKEETAVQGVASPAGRPVVARNPETDRLRQADNPALEIPAILLEGDRSPPPPVSGPGRRYALGTAAPGEQGEKAEFQRELPEAYGTKRLMLAPRDPHWVYAHWDLTSEQQRQCNELSAEGLLILRVHADSLAGERVAQVHVHPESRHWFVHVGQAGRTYVAELGCTNRDREWVSIAVSEAARTPPDTMSADTSIQFATVAPDIPLWARPETVKPPQPERESQANAEHPATAADLVERAETPSDAAATWTLEQEQALSETLSLDAACRGLSGSMQIAGLARGIPQESASMAAAQFTPPPAASPGASSADRSVAPSRAFWLNVNADVILYGATEPGSVLTLGGRRIPLRSDGTFSCRLALPEGQHSLPVVATSADGDEMRWADLQIVRSTQYGGGVGAHPQDPTLSAPPGSL